VNDHRACIRAYRAHRKGISRNAHQAFCERGFCRADDSGERPFAQSTGSIDFEDENEIVVTGSRANNGVNGIVVPDTSKAKGVLTQEFIQRQAPGPRSTT
jgi:hypothetical protein